MAFRIATLGAMTTHKGLLLLRRCAELAAHSGMPLEFVAIGPINGGNDDEPFRATGAYEERELESIIEHEAPDLIWFPVRSPETFSFTLSAALATNRRVAVPDIGALPERVAGRSSALVYPVASTPNEILALFNRLASGAKIEDVHHDVAVQPQARASRARRAPLVTFETRSAQGQYDACAYIRVRLPLRHPSLGFPFDIVSHLPQIAFEGDASAIVVQRTAIEDIDVAEATIDNARRRGIPLIYETDDDLFNIPSAHPEAEHYRRTTLGARIVAAAADFVTVSSPGLATALKGINPNIVVIPNALDETLWFDRTSAQTIEDGWTRILYMGTFTHEGDLMLLEEPMKRLRSRFGERIRLEVLGIATSLPDWCDRVDVPWPKAGSYPMFVRWLRSIRNRWSFAVAPLAESTFNAKKSLIKFLDYGAVGLSGIYSAGDPYDQLREFRAPVVLTENDPDAWFDAMSEFILNRAERQSLNRNAEHIVRTEFTLASQAALRRAKWESIVGTRRSTGVV